jgi:hypothetical protein
MDWEVMRLRIYIPTYNRPSALLGKDYFKAAVYVLPESQRDEYFKALPQKRMIVIPDENDGNLCRKQNWMLRNLERPYLKIDDDVSALAHVEKGSRKRINKHIKLSPAQAESLIISGFNLAGEWGCVYWGINVNTDGRNYQQYKPFSLTQPCLGPFNGHLKHDLYYDERMSGKDDFDFSLQVLHKHKKLLRMNKYSYTCKHGDNKGGWVSERTKETEINDCNAIMKKWGREIIKYKIPPRNKNDLLNGRLRVPIKGV